MNPLQVAFEQGQEAFYNKKDCSYKLSEQPELNREFWRGFDLEKRKQKTK